MRYFKKRYQKPGTPPGTLTLHEKVKHRKTRIRVLDYSPLHFEEKEVSSPEKCVKYKETDTKTWINVDGISNLEILNKLSSDYNFHFLALEDVLNVGGRPKVDNYEGYKFLIFRLLRYREKLEVEQVSCFFSKNFLFTFQEDEIDPFEPVRNSIRTNSGKIRNMGTDYLLYSLLDMAIDEVFPILEDYGEKIEEVEKELVLNPSSETLLKINEIKRDLLILRRSIWPEREVINSLILDTTSLISDEVKVYLRDCYDHIIQIMDIIETYRDLASNMLDVYLSALSNKTNEIMKILTIIATIFIPLTFIVGIYGMNFNTSISPYNMPELNWPFGYLFVWLIMFIIVLIMVLYFRRKKWF